MKRFIVEGGGGLPLFSGPGWRNRVLPHAAKKQEQEVLNYKHNHQLMGRFMQ
jgi:hypothetical protein